MLRPYVIAIDPGTTESGVCIVRTEDYKPLWCAKLPNEEVLHNVVCELSDRKIYGCDFELVIERMQGNSMPVSSDVFLTCEWIGRFDYMFCGVNAHQTGYVIRREEYKALCANIYTHNDKGVRSSLIDRFAYGEPNYGKGTKKAPGWFYGFAADTWSAYAIAVTYIDREMEA